VRKRGTIAVVLACLVGLSAVPPAAGASAYTQVLHAYQQTGAVPACRFTSGQLAAALRGIDTYGQQYFADFSDAVQSALAARAAGACAPGAHRVRRFAPAAQAPLPASVTSATNASLPLPLLALAGLSVLLAAAAGAGALLRAGGWEPGWVVTWRHAWGEASYRMAGRLADLAERWRGR
jgi:hypothetical protein